MKAIILEGYGDVDQLKAVDLPVPSPTGGQVLVKLEASALNHIDLVLRRGFMAQRMPLHFPAILGGDGAGTITAVGPGVTSFKPGDRVAVHFKVDGKGAHAEYALADVAGLAHIPDSMPFEQAATLPYAGLTARQVVDTLGVGSGDRVLVSGAVGSVGRAAVQYLKELGATPVAGARADQLPLGRQVVGEALDIAEAPSGPVFDYAVSAALPAAAQIVKHVRDGGRIASAVPTPPEANADHRVHISMVAHRENPAMLQAVVDAAARGELIIPIAMTFPLDQLGAAHKSLAAGAKGKIVIIH
jgi:NADPH:quinone reductase-like Zn-dependent oxidoreductase